MTQDHRPRGNQPPEGEAHLSPALPGRGELILVAEDDDHLRTAVSRMLQSLGFAVVTAANGLEGVAMVDKCSDRVQVVLTDVVMPDLDGPGMVEQLASRGIHPGVIYMSGYTDPGVLARVPCSPKAPLLIKPFTLLALVRLLREMLDRGGCP